MALVTPAYSRKRVDAAGDTLVSTDLVMESEREEALTIVNNWRSSHRPPLNVITQLLRERSKRVDPGALIAQRIKRRSAIEAKLRRFRTMRLSKMQDIGGCRAVVQDPKLLAELVHVYKHRDSRNKDQTRTYLYEEYDYITKPKDDGYRSYHLVYKYVSRTRPAHNDLRIEIQLRSTWQHAWATALETVDAFKGSALKSNMGDPLWARFFLLMSAFVARLEEAAEPPNVPSDFSELREEIRALATQLRAINVLEGLTVTVGGVDELIQPGAKTFLLRLDPITKQIGVRGYTAKQERLAIQETQEMEREVEDHPNGIQVVLVSVESVAALRKAYPNYYLDTTLFVRVVKIALGEVVEPNEKESA
jgi:hypothetical protein